MTDTTQPPAETLAIDHARACLKTIGETKHVQIKRDALETLLAALTRRAGGDAIPAGWGEMLRQSAAKHAVVCAHLANETPIAGEPDPLWWERQSAIREAAVILAHVGALPTPKPPAGGDTGAVERERDEARQIVRDIYWMARRYADGRQSYAVGMFNDAVRKAYEAGWLTHRMNDEPAFARDGMFSGEWKSIEQRARDAEERLAALALPAPVVEGEAQKLRDALRDLEAACDDLAANRSRETYHNMIHCDRATPYLEALDEARRNARAALSEGRSHG